MPDRIIYTFLPPVINQRLSGLLENGQIIRISRIVMLEESQIAHALLGPQSGYFATSKNGSRYILILLPVSALQAWLADVLGVPIPGKELTTT